MKRQRDRLGIVADILEVVERRGEKGGVGVGTLLRTCGVSYSRLCSLLSEMVESGLLLVPRTADGKYVVGERGAEFLERYRQFRSFASAYGLETQMHG